MVLVASKGNANTGCSVVALVEAFWASVTSVLESRRRQIERRKAMFVRLFLLLFFWYNVSGQAIGKFFQMSGMVRSLYVVQALRGLFSLRIAVSIERDQQQSASSPRFYPQLFLPDDSWSCSVGELDVGYANLTSTRTPQRGCPPLVHAGSPLV